MQQSKSHLALLAAGLIFGVNYWIAKGLMPVWFTPAQILFFRISVSTLLFWLSGLFYPADPLTIQEKLRVALCSILGVVLNQYLFFEGLKLSHPVQTAILHTTSPIFVMVFASLLLGEKTGWSKVAGIALGAAGAMGLVLQKAEVNFSTDTLTGNLFILGNIISYSLYLVLIKPVMAKHNALTVIKWAFLFGLVFSTPFTLPGLGGIAWDKMPAEILTGIIFVVLGATFLAYLLTIYALKFLPALVVGFYIYLQPLLAGFIGWIFFKDQPTLMNLIAAILIFTGVYLVNRPAKPAKTYGGKGPAASP